jgi:pimeloyl-ACP methyl ester carboxylesterase
VPILFIRGMQSDIVPEAGIDEFRSALPSLEVFDMSGAGHMVVAGDESDALTRESAHF